MQNENVITVYTVVINDPLTDVEMYTLEDCQSTFGIKNAEMTPSLINLSTDLPTNEIFGAIANWMDSIGAVENIFCIQKIVSHYTGYTSPEVKELMRI